MRVSLLDQGISQSVYVTGAYELGELQLIRRVVQPGMIAVDVGANIGVHTLILAERVGSSGVVHSFEPSAAFERLEENVRLNQFEARVRLNRCALGAKSGMLKLAHCTPGYEAFSSAGTPLLGSDGRTFDISMDALDSYARKNGISSIDFLKVDVEGFEPQVFQGAGYLLSQRAIRYIMFEFNEACLLASSQDPLELIRMLRGSGFDLQVLERDGQFLPCPDLPKGNWTTIVGRLMSGQA